MTSDVRIDRRVAWLAIEQPTWQNEQVVVREGSPETRFMALSRFKPR